MVLSTAALLALSGSTGTGFAGNNMLPLLALSGDSSIDTTTALLLSQQQGGAAFGGNNMLPYLALAGDDLDMNQYLRYNAFGQGENLMTLMALDDQFDADQYMRMQALSGRPITADTMAMMQLQQDGLTSDNLLSFAAATGRPMQSMLPLLATTTDGLTSDNLLTYSMLGNGAFGGNSMLPLLMSDSTSLNTDNYLKYSMLSGNQQMGGMLPLLALSGDSSIVDVSSDAMRLPMLVNAMAGGRTPSLSRDVLPAALMTGTSMQDAVLPFVMSQQGARYQGNMMPLLAANGDLTASTLTGSALNWQVAGQMYGPQTTVAPRTVRAPVRRFVQAAPVRVAEESSEEAN